MRRNGPGKVTRGGVRAVVAGRGSAGHGAMVGASHSGLRDGAGLGSAQRGGAVICVCF